MQAMLEGILRAEEMQAVPVLSVEGSGASEGDRAAFADLVEEGLVRASVLEQTFGGWMIRQLRLTQDGRRWLDEHQAVNAVVPVAMVGLSDVQLRIVEHSATSVGRLLDEYEDDLPDDAAATIQAQHRILADAQRGNNDVPLLRRSLQLILAAIGAVVGGVVANLISDQITPVVSAALAALG